MSEGLKVIHTSLKLASASVRHVPGEHSPQPLRVASKGDLSPNWRLVAKLATSDPCLRLMWRLEEVGDLGGDSNTNLAISWRSEKNVSVCVDLPYFYVIFASVSWRHVKDRANPFNSGLKGY